MNCGHKSWEHHLAKEIMFKIIRIVLHNYNRTCVSQNTSKKSSDISMCSVICSHVKFFFGSKTGRFAELCCLNKVV